MTSVTIPNSITRIGDNTFTLCSGLKEVHISDLTAWCKISFENFESNPLIYAHNLYLNDILVTDLTIPDSVTSIVDYAFIGCNNLISVTIPNSVTSIGGYAFENCRSLTSVNIPNSVTSVGEGAFNGCSGINYVTLSNNIDSIKDETFRNCSGLTSITIPNSVTNIGERAFDNCSGLTSVSIPNSVTSIGTHAFYYCSSLESITLSNSIERIEHMTFGFCSQLANIIIPESVTYIGESAFIGCSSLKSIVIPKNVTFIGYFIFNKCNNLISIVVDSENTTFDSRDNCNAIIETATNTLIRGCKNTVIPNSVVRIGDWALNNLGTLLSIEIPNGIKSIGDGAFGGCENLSTVTIPNSVDSIGCWAFEYCGLTDIYNYSEIPQPIYKESPTFPGVDKSLCTLHIPYFSLNLYQSAKEWKEFSKIEFLPCSDIVASGTCGKDGDNLTWKLTCDGVMTISGTGGMMNYTDKDVAPWQSNRSSIRSIIIDDGVTSIGDYAFYSCSSMKEVSIPNSVTNINYRSFMKCSGLDSINIPIGVTNISTQAFYECSGLESVNIPNTLRNVGKSAFYKCYRCDVYITDLFAWCNIDFPDDSSNPLYGGDNRNYLFLNGNVIKDLTIPEGITSIKSYTFATCRLTSVNISNSVTSIGSYAFYNCSGLTSITIPNSVTSIGDDAFYGCSSLTSVTIPNSVTSIGRGAFFGCKSLTSVTIPNSVSSLGDYTFLTVKYAILYPEIPPTIIAEPLSNSKKPFSNTSTIYVPNNTYFQAEDWKNFNLKYFCSAEQTNTPTSAILNLTHNIWAFDNNYIVSCGMEGGETFEGNTLEYIGLEPDSEYKDVPIVVSSNIGEIETVNISFTTSALTLTTQPAKPVSSNTAILLAETNMADIETSCGFEYKRNDAPADMEGNKVLCPVANGQMAGRLKGLKDDVYYKYRAFYKSSAGNMYYGDWQYIFTGDVAVEFDPILYTYEASNVQETQARLRGYALAGSDDFTEQGFEYWADSRTTPTNIIARAPQATLETIGEHHTIQANGISMSVNLNNLDAGTTYRYRTYAKIGSQTLYGAEMSFTTKGEYTPPTYTITFVNFDNSPLLTLTNVEQGTLPVYTGDTPTRDDDDEYTYTFRGWQPEIVAAEADATYTATYNAAKKTDAIDIISADENSVGPRKIIENGRLYIILPNGKKYTATGEEVR